MTLSHTKCVITLFIIEFAIYFATPSLISSWKLSALIVISINMMLVGSIFLFSLNRGGAPLRCHWPTFGLSVAIVTLVSAAGLYGYFYGAEIGQIASLNALAYFWIAIIIAFPLILLWRFHDHDNSTLFLVEIFYRSIILFCLLQAFLIAMHIKSPSAEFLPQFDRDAVLMRYLGFSSQRIALPISSGFQSGAILPLTLAVMAIIRLTTRVRSIDVASGFLGIFLLLMLDVQQFVVAAVLAPLICSRIFAPAVIAMIAAMSPWIYVTSISIISIFPTLESIGNARGASRYGLFSGRQLIWESFWSYFSSASWSQFLFGNGTFGQATSGLSHQYALLFSQWPQTTKLLAGLHNSYLQVIVDFGVIGLVLAMSFIAALVFRAIRLSRSQHDDAAAWHQIGGVAVAIAIVAASEVSLTIYMKEGVAVLVPVTLITFMYGGSIRRHSQTGDVRFSRV